MAENNQPIGDALAVLERGPREKADFAPLGPVWQAQSGNLNLTMLAEPLEWRNPSVRRVIIIRLRPGCSLVADRPQAPFRGESRSYAPPVDRTPTPPAAGGGGVDDEIPFEVHVDDSELGRTAVGHGAG